MECYLFYLHIFDVEVTFIWTVGSQGLQFRENEFSHTHGWNTLKSKCKKVRERGEDFVDLK